jgi:hypothetical protein
MPIVEISNYSDKHENFKINAIGVNLSILEYCIEHFKKENKQHIEYVFEDDFTLTINIK